MLGNFVKNIVKKKEYSNAIWEEISPHSIVLWGAVGSFWNNLFLSRNLDYKRENSSLW